MKNIYTLWKYEKKIDKRVIYFNKILSKWIAYHTNFSIESINQKRLLWLSLLLVFVHDNWQEINKFYPAQTKCKPSYKIYSALRSKLLLTLKTDIIFDFPKPRFFNITGFIRSFISSFKTTFNLIKAVKNKQNIAATNKVITKNLNIPFLEIYDCLIFSDIYAWVKRISARRKLNIFLSENLVGFNTEILTKIIPIYLVELLPIYQKISSKLSIYEIHTWVMDINCRPLLFINCLFNKDIRVIGYQHGGGYGYFYDEYTEAEMSFYDHFYHWGYSKNTIYPLRFKTKKKYSYYPNQKASKIVNFFLDSYSIKPFCTDFTNINNMATKLDLMGTNLNIVLHPNDYKFTSGKINKSTKRIRIFVTSKEIKFDRNAIYLVSIYSTLFWKVIHKKLCFICYKGDVIYLTEYHVNLSKLMEKNKLIFKFDELTTLLSNDFYKEIIINNQEFYREVHHL